MKDLSGRAYKLAEILFSAKDLLMSGYTKTPGSQLERFKALDVNEKTSFKDLVTVYDARVERFIVDELKRAYVGEEIFGEETAPKPFTPENVQTDAFWVIDPIDGTTNYLRAYPFFCTTAAYLTRQSDGRFAAQVAATYNPVSDEMFVAWSGGGAWLNREKLNVTKLSEPKQLLLTTGFASERSQDSNRPFDLFTQLTKKTLGVRRDGSAALDLAYVAAGRIDGYWEWGLAPWDIASGALLVLEAGGIVSGHGKKTFDPFKGEIIATNGFIHSWLCDHIDGTYESARH